MREPNRALSPREAAGSVYPHCAAWRDVYAFPPADGQSVWLRRYPEDTAAFRATFDANNLTFTLPAGWQLCSFDAWKWTS